MLARGRRVHSFVAGCVLVGGCLILSGRPAWAQTNDALYRSWRWSPTLGSPRAAGLGGAVVGLADDSSAALLNPAGMTTLTKSELGAAVVSVARGETTAHQDVFGSWAGPGFIGGAGRLGARLAIGGYLSQSRGGTLGLTSAFEAPPGTTYSGSVESEIIDSGAAVAWQARPRLNVGVRLTATHLKLSAVYRQSSSGIATVESGAAAGHTRVTGSLGVLYARESWRLGLVVHPGASYTVDRTANDLRRGDPIDPGSEYEIRAPGVMSGGGAWQLSPRFLVVGQLDYVRYSEIAGALVVRPGAAARPASEYELEDGIEGRFGVEASWPFRSWALQLRGGLVNLAPGSLRYVGSDPAELLSWPGSDREWLTALGATVATKGGFSLDGAATFGGERAELVVGARFRF
jgi:long-subunit fatty acid transport protein